MIAHLRHINENTTYKHGEQNKSSEIEMWCSTMNTDLQPLIILNRCMKNQINDSVEEANLSYSKGHIWSHF